MSVHYKFKSTLDYDTVSFDGLHISVADLKKAIFHQKRIGKNTDFDLQITNAQTKEDYTDDNALIAKNTSLIIARVPLTVQQKRSWDRNEQQSFANSKDEAAMGHTVDLTRLDGSEEDKIRAMMTQSTQDYDPSNYMKIRGANQTGEVPPNYRCYKCHQPGHWIKNCPLGINQEPIEIKKSTGIPRSFMVPVEGPLVPGAMMTPTGHYAVPAIDHQAYKEGKKERPPFFQDPEPVAEKPEIPEDLICSICKDLLTDAVMVPCCGNSYCDECIRSSLLESEEHECPGCNEKDVSPETLIPNRYLRGNVLQFNNKTGYAKRQTYRPAVVKSQTPVLDKEKTENSPSELSQEAPKVNPPTQDASLSAPTATVANEPTPEPETPETTVPPVADEESEVVPPPPPGTEPLLPIPSVTKSPEKESEPIEDHITERRDYEDDYGGDYGGDYADDRRPRERGRSFSKEGHRERSGEGGRRIENIRSMNRRRSLSPRQRSDYQAHGTPLPHMMNQSKGYQNIQSGNQQRYPSSMHYDSELRRSTEDRPGTPTVDEPHLHQQSGVNQAPLLPYPPGEERIPPPPPQSYNQPPPRMPQHNPPLLPDPYMGHRMPMYSHQQGPHYGPPRYDRPPYQQPGYRSSQPPRNYNGPPRPMRGMHHLGYRGMQPPPPGLGRSMHNGNPPGVIDDPLEAFERMLREKDERDRRLGKHRRRSRTRSRSRSYTRSRSRSFNRRSPLPSRLSRSRSPPPKRRSTRSPPPRRSRTPKRRSRSGSFSISRSRSYSRSQSPRGSISRDRDRERDRERDRDRDRDLPPRYRSPVRSPPRFQRDRERDRERGRSREPRETYSSYYNDSPANDYEYRGRERDVSNRDRGTRYQSRNQSSQHSSIPPLMSHPMPPLLSMGSTQQPERKDYYDSYNRYPGQSQRFNSPGRDHKRFDDVAPPGTEGYYDLPPPGVDHPERSREERDRSRVSKDNEDHGKDGDGDDKSLRDDSRIRDRERDDRDRRLPDRDRDRERERDDREKSTLREKSERRDKDKERDDRYIRDRRDDDRPLDKRDYDVNRYKDDRDRHRIDEKNRGRERDRKDRDYDFERDRERHERHSADRKKSKKSSSPHPQKSRSENKDSSPERPKKKEKDHEEKTEEKKKEKKIKDKKKKKDSEEKEKKKKKKKEKKTLRELAKSENAKLTAEADNFSVEPKQIDTSSEIKSDDINEERNESNGLTVSVIDPMKDEFEDKSLMMNPEPPEFTEHEQSHEIDPEFSHNPPNPNFKPIPELKPDMKPIESLYSGLDDTEINAVITEKYTLIPTEANKVKSEDVPEETLPNNPDITDENVQISVSSPIHSEKSPKKDEFLAPLPELSKWERDDTIEKSDENVPESPQPTDTPVDESKSTKVVTSEVLKRAENAIFQKAINAIRPIEIKKISESRKILYQNPEPKITEQDNNRERKSVNVTINIGRNERNVEITEPIKKGKLDRSKFKGDSHSPTRLSAKERLGEKVDDDKDKKIQPIKQFVDKKEPIKNDNPSRSKSPRIRDRKLSPMIERRVDLPSSTNSERKVFLDDRKHRLDNSRERSGGRQDKHDLRDTKGETKQEFRQSRGDYRQDRSEKERRGRTPPSVYKRDDGLKTNTTKRKSEEEEIDKKKDKKGREEKKRKKDHRSRSKSRDRKRKKEKKHKKDKEKILEKKQKHKEEKLQINEEKTIPDNVNPEESPSKKQRKNPRLVSDRKRSVLDEASFEPDYSATDSESEGEDGKTLKKPKLDETQVDIDKETETKVTKRRIKSTSSDDDSSTSDSTTTDTDSSEDSHRKRKKKHKKHKKRKSRKESSSDSESYTDTTDSSTDDEKHKKKSKKSKSKSKQSKKKKKSKHK